MSRPLKLTGGLSERLARVAALFGALVACNPQSDFNAINPHQKSYVDGPGSRLTAGPYDRVGTELSGAESYLYAWRRDDGGQSLTIFAQGDMTGCRITPNAYTWLASRPRILASLSACVCPETLMKRLPYTAGGVHPIQGIVVVEAPLEPDCVPPVLGSSKLPDEPDEPVELSPAALSPAALPPAALPPAALPPAALPPPALAPPAASPVGVLFAAEQPTANTPQAKTKIDRGNDVVRKREIPSRRLGLSRT